MMFFSSDLHVSHRNIVEYSKRPFSSLDEMTEAIIANHNAVVNDEDTVYNLGDFSFKPNTIPGILSRMKGTHILLPGNHDEAHVSHSKYANAVEKYKRYGFADVLVQPQEIVIGGQLGLMQHLPAIGDGDHRFPNLRKKPEEYARDYKFLLHGHCHELFKYRTDGGIVQINVGVDVWDFTPVSIDTIERLIVSLQASGDLILPPQRQMLHSR
jgi:calcineurin-like phosphoesterase family protein